MNERIPHDDPTPASDAVLAHDSTAGAAGDPHAHDDADEKRGTRTVTEEFKISGEAVIGKVKELVREGNVRRIIVANEEGRILLEVPLTIGVIGTVLLPVWAAIGAVAALAANLTLRVERRVPADEVDAAADGADPSDSAGDATGG